MTNREPNSEHPSPPIVRLVVSWALVGLPLAWGVWQVFRKSLDLFR